MEHLIQKMLREKREYRAQMARVQAMPEAYRFVYDKIQGYLWQFAGGTGIDMLKTQYDLIDLLEAGAASGRHVLEVTGRDVAAFCDDLMRGNRLWTDSIKDRLNRHISTRLNTKSTD